MVKSNVNHDGPEKSRNNTLEVRIENTSEEDKSKNSSRNKNDGQARNNNNRIKSNLSRRKAKKFTANKDNSLTQKKKVSSSSNNKTTFDRLGNHETLTIVDREGKTSQTRKGKNRTKRHVPSSSDGQPVHHSKEKIEDNARRYQKEEMRHRRKKIQKSVPLSSLLAEPEYDCLFDAEKNQYLISTPMPFTHCPEFEALSELNRRIKDNLSRSCLSRSNHSQSTVRHNNRSGNIIGQEKTSEDDEEMSYGIQIRTKNHPILASGTAFSEAKKIKTKHISRLDTCPTTQRKRHSSFASQNTALFNRLSKHETFASANRRISPEVVAIDELNQRVKASLSITYFSQNDDNSYQRNDEHVSIRKYLQSSTIDEVEGGNDTDDQDYGKLFDLIWERQFDTAKAYIKDINQMTKRKSALYQNQDGWNALMRAFYRTRPKYIDVQDLLIKDLIQIGGKEAATMTNIYGDNALVCAIRNKHSIEIIQLLLKIGGGKEYVLQRNFRGRTSLHWACEMNSSIDIVKCLVEFGGKELVVMEDDTGVRAKSNTADVMNYLIGIDGALKQKPIPNTY